MTICVDLRPTLRWMVVGVVFVIALTAFSRKLIPRHAEKLRPSKGPTEVDMDTIPAGQNEEVYI